MYICLISLKVQVIKIKLFDSNRLNFYCTLYETVIPCLEFSIEFQSNNLIYHKEYTKRQQLIYALIKHLHDEEVVRFFKGENLINVVPIEEYDVQRQSI